MKKIYYINKSIEMIVVVILGVMSLLVFLNVILRYGFNSGINITEEVSRYLFVWLVFLGAILAFNDNQHVSVSTVVEKFSKKNRQLIRIFTDALMLFCCYLIAIGSFEQFMLNKANLSPISGIPTGISYLASFIASLAIGILLISRIIAVFTTLLRGERE